MPWKLGVVAAGLIAVCGLPAPVAAGQTVASASVSGTVSDPSGVLPGATVRLRNVETNEIREVVADERGRYRLLYVPVGRYELTATVHDLAAGHGAADADGGPDPRRAARLTSAALSRVGSRLRQRAPLVETTRTQSSDTIAPQEIDSLPLNGRNYLDLALLVPNVTRTNTRSAERFAETSAVPGTGITVAGQRNIGNSFIVDGLSANDDAADLAGTYYGQEVIREFQVITSGGAAEFGRASAGTINIVTQSGTNHVHGRLYGFFRNDALDARNALATSPDPLSQQQYGITFGGPLSKDRTFGFANVERTQQDKTGFVTIAPANVTAVNAALDAFGYGGPRIGTGAFRDRLRHHQRVRPAGSRAPERARGSRRATASTTSSSANARNVGGLNDVSRGHAARGHRPDRRGQHAVDAVVDDFPRSARAGDAQPARRAGQRHDRSGGERLRRRLVRHLHDVADRARPRRRAGGRHDHHSARVAPDQGRRRPPLQPRHDPVPGRDAGPVHVHLAGQPAARRSTSSISRRSAIPSVRQSNPNLGLFVQDEWRPATALTVTGGLRYDLQELPDPIALDANNVSPRLGVAWAPGAGRTVVRASGGLYFDRIPLRATANALQRDGVTYRTAVLSFGAGGRAGRSRTRWRRSRATC